MKKKLFKESSLQISCVRWFDLQYPKLKLNLFSIPNEGARSPANGARMKAQGRRAGVADMFLAVPKMDKLKILAQMNGGIYHGLFVEFKSGSGKQNENQISFEKTVKQWSYRYEVISSFDEFKQLIESYLK